MPGHEISQDYRHLFVGSDVQVPLLDGGHTIYINLDNAASTPSLKAVQQTVDRFLPYYSSVHRGTGYKSQLSTHNYEAARKKVLSFLNADSREHICVFGKNTTEAINKLANRFPFSTQRDIVLTSGMEHHSNDLPWRKAAKTIHIDLRADGNLDEKDLERLLDLYAERIALLAITGASNVTGYLNRVHNLAEKAHAVGAQILVDAAQLAAHRKIDMRPLSDPAHLDYVAISAHKMYAPFGSGALVGRRDIFEVGDPDMRGGGTVEIVTLNDVVWASPPDREEAGSPNTVGAVALAAAIQELEAIGMGNIAHHEARLTNYALSRLIALPNVRIYGDDDSQNGYNRLGVIPFEVMGVSHFKVAAILGYEFGIGVRSGCFCAHPYILRLLNLSGDEAEITRKRILAGDKSEMPGLVRASFGLYNTKEDVDALVDALVRIEHGDYSGQYIQDASTGEFIPQGWKPNFTSYFDLGLRPS